MKNGGGAKGPSRPTQAGGKAPLTAGLVPIAPRIPQKPTTPKK